MVLKYAFYSSMLKPVNTIKDVTFMDDTIKVTPQTGNLEQKDKEKRDKGREGNNSIMR